MSHAATLFQLGQEAMQKKDLQGAYNFFLQAMLAEPENYIYHRALAESASPLAFSAIQLHAQAVLSAQRACVLAQTDPDNWLTLGNVGLAAAHYELAISAFERAATFGKNLASLHSAIGHLYAKLSNREKAIEHYKIALEHDPENAEAHYLLGCQYLDAHRDVAKLAYHSEKGIPSRFAGSAKWNAANGYLALGDYDKGWKYFEARHEQEEFGNFVDHTYNRFHEIPNWKKEKGKKVLVMWEWGFGDSLQMCRYLPLMVKDYDCEVVFECRQELVSLMTHSFEGLPVKVVPFPVMEPQVDCKLLLMSLPAVFETKLDTIPNQFPYLKPHPAQIKRWGKIFDETDKRPRIGICWAGEDRSYDANLHRVDKQRSIPFDKIKPLLEIDGINWISLQLGSRGKDFPAPEGISDFSDTAAIIHYLDAVVTADTSVVHLAGGMNKPTWMLSRYDGCWRWVDKREDSPWYPSVRILRQERFDDWSVPLVKLMEEISHDLTNRGARCV